MLQGKAKRAYQREYMRKKRAGEVTRKPKTVEEIDAAIKRWKTRLKRAFTALDKLDHERRRLGAIPKTKPILSERRTPPVTMIAIAGSEGEQ